MFQMLPAGRSDGLWYPLPRRGVRVVDGAALEKRCAKAPRVRIPPSPPHSIIRTGRHPRPVLMYPGRGRLVDYGAALEMRFGATRRGFESRPLRHFAPRPARSMPALAPAVLAHAPWGALAPVLGRRLDRPAAALRNRDGCGRDAGGQLPPALPRDHEGREPGQRFGRHDRSYPADRRPGRDIPPSGSRGVHGDRAQTLAALAARWPASTLGHFARRPGAHGGVVASASSLTCLGARSLGCSAPPCPGRPFAGLQSPPST